MASSPGELLPKRIPPRSPLVAALAGAVALTLAVGLAPAALAEEPPAGSPPSGHVTPVAASSTPEAAGAAPAASPTPPPTPTPRPVSSREAFVEVAGEAARASQASTGVPASVTVAQAILESDWGRSTIGGANNYFGIKAAGAPGPAGVVWAQTTEFVNGAWISVQAPFRAYNSMAESFVDHGRFLVENRRYAPAFAYSDDPRAFARLIHAAGYATDPGYSDKLIAIMDRYDLYQFDLPGAVEPLGGILRPLAR